MTSTPASRQSGWPAGNAAEPSLPFGDGSVGLYLADPLTQGFAGGEARPGSLKIAAPLTGATVSAAAGQRNQILNPAGTIAALTLNLPPSPSDGQVFYFSSTQTVTALTLGTTDSSSIVGAVTTIAPGAGRRYIYQASDTSWYPY